MSNDWGFMSGTATYGVEAGGQGFVREVILDVKTVRVGAKAAQSAGGGLSAAAIGALIDAGTSRLGAIVAAPRSGSAALTELYSAGLIGPERGLTRAGSIRRDREIARRLDEAF